MPRISVQWSDRYFGKQQSNTLDGEKQIRWVLCVGRSDNDKYDRNYIDVELVPILISLDASGGSP